MASIFRALPLGNRDEAFLLETEHKSQAMVILFDSGRDQTRKGMGKLSTYFARHLPNIDHIDIAVCSHNDDDHSSGFVNFIRDWCPTKPNPGGIPKIRELWLPYLFKGIEEAVLDDPEKFVARLLQENIEFAATLDDGLKRTWLGGAGEGVPLSVRRTKRFAVPSRDGAEAAIMAARYEQAVRHTVRAEAGEGMLRPMAQAAMFQPRAGRRRQRPRNLQGILRRLARNLGSGEHTFRNVKKAPSLTLYCGFKLTKKQLEEAKAIVGLVGIAKNRGIGIRWFDFAYDDGEMLVPGGGERGLLEPLNAVEVFPVGRYRTFAKASDALAITIQNVEALVFWRPETATEPGAIFLTDSRLATGENRPEIDFPTPPNLSPDRPVLFTAAHHASDNNDNAYKVLRAWLGGAAFDRAVSVRNGGQSGMAVGTWSDLPKTRRRCAQCFQCFDGCWRLQQVNVASDASGNWIWPPDVTQPCGTPGTTRTVTDCQKA